MAHRATVIGAGLAGLAAASALAEQGCSVEIYEARARLGGRAASFDDNDSGQMVDTCQHVTMGCCTNFSHFCRTVGIDHLLEPQKYLYFMTPNRRVSRFAADGIMPPLHLARSFLGLHHLTFFEKISIARCLLKLKSMPPDVDPPFLPWLTEHKQTQRMIDRFWGLVLISALNEEPDRIGLRYARKVFVDGFMSHPKGFEVYVPTVPLGRLYGAELRSWLTKYGVKLHQGNPVKTVAIREGQVDHLQLRNGETVSSDSVVSTVPFDRLTAMLPDHAKEDSYFTDLQSLETSPITSAHCWYDRPIMKRPHVVLVDCMGQWVFNRGEANGEHYIQVVISAAGQFRTLGQAEIERRLTEELSRLFPAALPGALKRCRIVTEKHATFSAVPGVDQFRPTQKSPIEQLFVAGDWTATGWPATMEGAVRSGYLAAEALLGIEGIVQPDLA